MHSQSSNHESLMLEATALPTAPHLMPRPYTSFFTQKDNIYSGDILLSYWLLHFYAATMSSSSSRDRKVNNYAFSFHLYLFFKWVIRSIFFFYFRLFNTMQLTVNKCSLKFCLCLDSTRGPKVSEVTALQCDQIGRFIAIWVTFQRLGTQLFCPNSKAAASKTQIHKIAFPSFSQYNDKYSKNFDCRWSAWDLNPGPQDYTHRWIH